MGRDNTWGHLLYTLEPGEARGKGRIQLVGPGDLMGQDSFGRFGFAWLGGDLKEPCKSFPISYPWLYSCLPTRRGNQHNRQVERGYRSSGGRAFLRSSIGGWDGVIMDLPACGFGGLETLPFLVFQVAPSPFVLRT